MASYKIPQDVEAEDKLIGPFSFRQFIYLIVAAIGILVAWVLGRIFVGLIIIPLPIIIAFLALALPLRKDQPMETYLAAVIRFYLKPRMRLWVPEGTISLVTVTAPKTVEYQLTKGFSGSQASQQLSYLAQVVDSQGWSTRGVGGVSQGMSDIVVAEAQTAEDVLDEDADVARAFDQRITQTDELRRQAAAAGPSPTPTQPTPVTQPQSQTPAPVQAADAAAQAAADTPISFDPYPSSMRQHVLNPAPPPQATQPIVDTPEPIPAEQPSIETVSPDIIRLANNNDLSISTLAHEAHRLGEEGEEVEIKLH